MRAVTTAIPKSQIEYYANLKKEKIFNPLKFKKNVTRRDLTEQRITTSVMQFNSADVSLSE